MWSFLPLVVFPSVLLAVPSFRLPQNIVDMTHPLVPNDVMPLYPGHDKYTFTIKVRGDYPGTKIYGEYNTITLSDHTATHIDAPSHFARGKWRVHEIPLRNCIAEAVVIDVKEKAAHQLDASLDVEDIEEWEARNGPIPEGAFVFMNSGWGEKWGNRTAYMGTDTDQVKDLHYPGFHPDACKWLVDHRRVKAIGSDSLSADQAQRKDLGCHVYVEARNVLIFENVANINKIPQRGATVYAFPMNIYDGSGAPVRLVAMWNAASKSTIPSALPILSFSIIVMLRQLI